MVFDVVVAVGVELWRGRWDGGMMECWILVKKEEGECIREGVWEGYVAPGIGEFDVGVGFRIASIWTVREF